MNAARLIWISSVTAALILASASASRGQDSAQAEFQRGYYLQTHEGDLPGAAAAYERVAQDASAPEALRAEARLRLAQAREDLASADFARLMPPDVLAYAETSNPGRQIAQLARQMGLVREPGAPLNPKPEVTPLGDGVFFPHDFALSPALIDGLKSFRGAAAAITGIDAHGEPEGLLVLHPGDMDVIRGVLESAVQFAEPAEPIEGFKTYRLQEQGWIAVTARLFLAARGREPLIEAIRRLRNPEAPSLAASEDLKAARPDRDGALFFAYLNGPRAAKEFRQKVRSHDAPIVAGVFDLDHLKAVSAFVRATDNGLQLQARLDLMEGHHNLIYALIRTAPCSRTSLEYVPGGAAGVALLGLNPAGVPGPRSETTAGSADFLTAMDIGREFFANLEEAAVFVAPAKAGGPPIPDIGLVLIAKDPKRSEALWSQLLSLPAVFLPSKAAASQVTIEGAQATEYRFPNAPPVVLTRVRDRAIIIATRGAAATAIRAGSGNNPITQDPGFKPLLARLTPSTSKAVLIHAGRAADTAASVARNGEAEKLKLVASILANLRITLITDEKPTQFTLRAEASGLPNVPEAIRKLAAAHQGRPCATQVSRAEPPEGVN